LEQHRLSSEQLMCLFVDLNNFKSINDNYGHHVGDLLLVKVGRRLINRLRHDDFVSRFGGDEFVILASLKDPQLGRDAITKMVRSVCRDPIVVDDLEIRISCSIGSAIFPDDGECIDQLINVADRRMYQEKNIQRDGNVTVIAFKERH
jgi:diguanylate cyclase (GGDEF)-like protein